MNIYCIYICFLIQIVILVNGFMDFEIIEAYFKKKQTNYASIISCIKKREKIDIMKALISKSYVTRISNLNDANVIDGLITAHYHIGVVFDADCKEASKFLIQCGQNNFFDVKHHWLIMTSSKNCSTIFENIELYINANIHCIYPLAKETDTKHYLIEDVYNPAYGKGGKIRSNIIGFYNGNDGYQFEDTLQKYYVRRNMTGVTLQSMIVLPLPFEGDLMEYLDGDKNPEINTFNRFHYHVLKPCVNYYNFSTNITLNKSWGYLISNGTFDGIVGNLGKKLIDYGSSPLFVRTDRAQVMEYGRRTWILRAAFVFRSPKSINPVDIFLKPLPLTIWLLTFLSAIISVVLLKISGIWDRGNTKNEVEISWSYYITSTVGAFCQQGLLSVPNLFSGRIVALFLLILSLMVYQFYSASLVSYLLMKPPNRIKSLRDIINSDMKVGCEDTLYNRDYFHYTTDPLSKELYERKILGNKNTSNFLVPDEGLELVKHGKYAFHVELATAYPIIRNTFEEDKICGLAEVQMYKTQQMHANVQKHSPFRDMFDTCLQRLAEYGILHREINFWHPRKPACLQSTKNIKIAIGLDYFYPALLVLVFGMAISVTILIGEIIVYQRKDKNNSITNKTISTVYPYLN